MIANSLDLLDICRVLEAGNIDRSEYPLAKQSNCMLIQSLDDKMMFEACSESERDRICRDLKLVVARLGSKIIMNDRHLFDEILRRWHDSRRRSFVGST